MFARCIHGVVEVGRCPLMKNGYTAWRTILPDEARETNVSGLRKVD